MTITLTHEEAQQVLDALERLNRSGDTQVFDMYDAPVLIPLLRARLIAPEPEPAKLLLIPALMEQAGWVRKREWQGLTDEECDEIWDECLGVFDCLKMTEAKLKEKNT
jgi:hypothetical protein